MQLDFSVLGQVKVTMFDYIQEMLKDFHMFDPNKTISCTPAADHLFRVRDDQPKLDEQKAQKFHTFTAKVLFATKQARPDIHTSVAFLTIHVIFPDEGDWKILLRMMRYLRGTKELPLILSADSTNIVQWWVDRSYAIHPDARIQTGKTASLGKGSFMSTSIKQRLNTRISTETELVAADDLMPHLCWTNYFLECQGYNIHSTIMYQDNQSAILLENKGRASSSKRTKYLNIRYFYITDRIKKGDLHIEYCPTDNMVADFFTNRFKARNFSSSEK